MNGQRLRGRPPQTTGQFINVTRQGGSLYVAELTDGGVKVGFSNNPKTRLKSLNAEALRSFGASILRFHIYAGVEQTIKKNSDDPIRKRYVETLCLRAVSLKAVSRAPHTEYFDGLTFDAVREIVDNEIAQAKAA